jgi:hypothetical protein
MCQHVLPLRLYAAAFLLTGSLANWLLCRLLLTWTTALTSVLTAIVLLAALNSTLSGTVLMLEVVVRTKLAIRHG